MNKNNVHVKKKISVSVIKSSHAKKNVFKPVHYETREKKQTILSYTFDLGFRLSNLISYFKQNHTFSRPFTVEIKME